MRRLQIWLVVSLLTSSFLGGCALSDRGPPAALDTLVPLAIIHVAEDHLKAERLDPGPVDGIFTEETAEALRQYQRRYGLVASGLLDQATRFHMALEATPGEK